MKRLKRIVKTQEFSIFIPLVLLCIVAAFVNSSFVSSSNIIDLLKSISFSCVASGAMAYMIISGNLDLSCGAMITVGGMVCGGAMTQGIPWPLAILLGLAVCAFFGFLNGILVVKVGIASVIATLGMQYVIKGCVYITTKGNPFYPLEEDFNKIGQGSVGGLPFIVIIAVVVLFVFHIVLEHTSFGRAVMALGGNDEAARLAGIRTGRNRISLYVILGMFCGLSGILSASRVGSALASAGDGKELTIPAGVIIGGCSILGGRGSIIGAVIGVALLETIKNALVIMRLSAYWQDLATGLIMIVACAIDVIRQLNVGGAKKKTGTGK